jgi:O-antigen ligase
VAGLDRLKNSIRSGAAVVVLGWSVVSLGASHPWGYLPLIGAMTAYGLTSFNARGAANPIGGALAVTLTAFSAAILIQLVPLPAGVVRAISPAATQVTPGLYNGGSSLPLSVEPRATLLGWTFVTALSLFFVGVARRLRRGDAQRLARGLVVLGALIALIGIAEEGTSWQGVYGMLGLPLPPDSTPLGPFASRNHYAGWVLMALALTMAYLCAMLDRTMTRAHAGSGHQVPGSHVARVMWTILVASAVAAMSVVLIQTRSRAGILGLVATLAVIGGLLMRRITLPRTRLLVAAPLVLLPLIGVAVTGVQPLMSRFATTSWSTGHGRLPIWRQAIEIARDFPIAGSGFNTYQHVVRFYPVTDIDDPYEGAHNDFLQLALEGGLLVGIPALATTVFFVRQAHRRFRDASDDAMTRWIRIGAVMGLSLIAAQETVDFSLQVPGNAALFVVLAAIAIHRSETSAHV